MSEEFDLDWLDLREPHDAAARSEALAEALIARLPARPRLMDLGAGTGSLFRWLAPRIFHGAHRATEAEIGAHVAAFGAALDTLQGQRST